MREKERILLLQIKSDLYDQFHIIPEQLDIHTYLQMLVHTFNNHFPIVDIHFILHKQLFLQNQYLFTVLTGENISYFEDWQVSPYLTKTPEIPHPYEKPLFLENSQGELRAIILLQFSTDQDIVHLSDQFWAACSSICYHYLENVIQLLSVQLNNKRLKTVQTVTQQLFTTMDIKNIFSVLFAALRDFYPHFLYRLYVAHDEWLDMELPIYLLDFADDQSPEIQVFITGNIKKVESSESLYQFLYIPLTGKQGVYGVLEVVTNTSDLVGSVDIQFISSIAEMTSHAIENAQLYQQTKKLVENLQLVTEVSRHLNTRLRVSDLGAYFIKELKRSFDATGVAIVLERGNTFKTLEASSPYFFTINGKGLLTYLQNLFNKKREGIFVGDIGKDSRLNYGICSIMSEPLKQEGDFFGFIVIVDHRSYHFTFEEFKLFRSLTHHASLAFSNAILRDELESMVITDYLTKLATRSYLDEKMEQSMVHDQEGAFILIDIDNFKRINDIYGHQIGDQVLQQIAKIIKRHLYGSDIAARWGGEEIVVYLPNRNLNEGMELAEKLIQRIERETNPRVTISCGVSSWKQGGQDNPRKLFLEADKAMYEAKARGKNRAVAYTGR